MNVLRYFIVYSTVTQNLFSIKHVLLIEVECIDKYLK